MILELISVKISDETMTLVGRQNGAWPMFGRAGVSNAIIWCGNQPFRPDFRVLA